MSAIILDGKKIAEDIKLSLKKEIESIKVSYKSVPKLVSIGLADQGASSVYVASQKKQAEAIGLEYKSIDIKATHGEDKVISIIKGLNKDAKATGIIVQRPLPKNFNVNTIYSLISPLKDTEALHPENMGRLFSGSAVIIPPTAAAAMELIRKSNVKLYGKEVVIVGHSDIAGKPLAILLLNEFATVSVCHIATYETKNLKAHVNKAEVLIVAVGKPNLIKGEWIRKGAIVIDIGINKLGDKIVGDVEFTKASEKASYISPVPGGVGPVTTAMLMKNCINLFKLQRGLL